MKKMIAAAVMFVLLLNVTGNAQQFQQLLDNKTRDLLHEALSGELAKEHVIAITRHSRIQGSRQFRDAANYVLDNLRSYGFSDNDAYIESFKSDGKIHYQTWQSPSGFDMSWAELRMIEPYDERIVGYPEVAMSLITYSNPGEWGGELVWVGSGTSDTDYEGKDVRGKVVLATGYGGSVHRLAVLKYGALGVVCFLHDERSKEYPDMLRYTGMWPRSKELDRVTFGFNLTHRQGEKLKNLIMSGQKVVVRGKAEGVGLESYFMDVPVAYIRGSEKPDEILIYSAHLDHPKESANDNASGSAALLDMARTLKELIDTERLPRPKRTIQFMWIPEFYGTMAYIDKHPEMKGVQYGGKYLANINMDMVGENQEILHSRATYSRTPGSIPSVLNDVVENMVQMVAGMEVRTPRGSLSTFNYVITPYSGGSDHNMFIDRKIPGMMFGHSPDYTHHTSEDTPDKVDPVELEREEIIATGTFLYLADLTTDQALDLAYVAAGNAAKDLAHGAQRANRLLAASSENFANGWAEAQNIISHEAKWAKQAIASITIFNDEKEVTDLVGNLQKQIDSQLSHLTETLKNTAHNLGAKGKSAPKLHTEMDKRVAVRKTRGPIDGAYLNENLSANDLSWYQSSANTIRGNRQFELHNFLDGKMNVTEIRDAVSAEYGPVDHGVVKRYIEMLVNIGLAEWK